MKFKYSCFISYQHGKNEIISHVVMDLYKTLSTELSLYIDLPVFVDFKYSEASNSQDLDLMSILCQSICLIPILTPMYFSKNTLYCAREYKAMEKLEKDRLALLSRQKIPSGLIIPIILRGVDMLPLEIKSQRSCVDFSNFLLVDSSTRETSSYHRKITEIARYIYTCYEVLMSLPDERRCDDSVLPSDNEVQQWLKKLSPDKPTFPSIV